MGGGGLGVPLNFNWSPTDGSGYEESDCGSGDLGLIPGSGRYPGEGNGNPLQYSCLENFMDRGTLWAISPWGQKRWDITE